MHGSHFVDGPEAARRLGVSIRRVHQLGTTGAIAKVARGLYDARSIELYLAARRGAGTKSWAPATTWAAVALLSSGAADVTWIPDRSIFRLKAVLRTMTVDQLVVKARARADVRRFQGGSATANRLRSRVALRDWSSLGLAGTMEHHLDGYIGLNEFHSALKRHLLIPDLSGSITLRVTQFDPSVVRELVTEEDSVVVALDAASEIDPRARAAGERELAQALGRFAQKR